MRWLKNQGFVLTMNSDIMFALILSGHVDSDAGVTSGVNHLSVSDADESAVTEDLDSRTTSQGSAVFQPGDSRPGHAVGFALQGDVSSSYRRHVTCSAAWWADGGTN